MSWQAVNLNGKPAFSVPMGATKWLRWGWHASRWRIQAIFRGRLVLDFAPLVVRSYWRKSARRWETRYTLFGHLLPLWLCGRAGDRFGVPMNER